MNLRNSIEAFLNSYDIIKMLSSDWLTSSGQNNKIGHYLCTNPIWELLDSGWVWVVGRCGGAVGVFEVFPKVVGPTDL